MSLNVRSDGMGRWIYKIIKPLLNRIFPHTNITYDDTKAPDLVVRSHFLGREQLTPYTCPYICWSGESYPVSWASTHPPIFELNTFYTDKPTNVYFPHLAAEVSSIERPDPNPPKRYCCAYAFSNSVPMRELMFKAMRRLEPTCYSFGSSCRTSDNPPISAPQSKRDQNGSVFQEFGFVNAMENGSKPGYLTEKIGYAFKNGGIPIYYGDTDTVNEVFNPAAFLDVAQFPSVVKAAETAVQIWRDPQKYQTFIDAPIFSSDKYQRYMKVYTEYDVWQKPMYDRLRDAFPDLS